jgi:hypothetical protein
MGIVWTLRARGLVPSLGAGGSLVVASLCCLLFATALLTFRDWPGAGDASPGGAITMTPPAAKAAGRSASGPSAAAIVPAPAAPAAPAARERTSGARRPARRTAPRRGASGPQAPTRTSPPAASQPAPAAAPGPAPAASSPTPGTPQGGGDRLPLPELPSVPQPAPGAGPVESVVETVRGVEKPLPPVIRQPVEPVLDTVQEVGRTVDGVTGRLLPALPE